MQYIPDLLRISTWPLEASEFKIPDFKLLKNWATFLHDGREPFLHTQTKGKDSEWEQKCNWADKRHNEVEKWLKQEKVTAESFPFSTINTDNGT